MGSHAAGCSERQAAYLYCVLPRIKRRDFGPVGIDGNRVYAITHNGLMALAHDCPPEPYQGDDESVKQWVIAHSDVVATAWREAGVVLPMAFDVIVAGDEHDSAQDKVLGWLRDEYENLQAKLQELEGKVEVGVQILWSPEQLIQEIGQENEEISRLKSEMQGKSRGAAYFDRQKLEKLLKEQLETTAAESFRSCYERIAQHAEQIQVEKPKRRQEPDWEMLMNLSVLVRKERIKALGTELGAIEGLFGFKVRFTGPWPPYSFVTTLAVGTRQKNGGDGDGSSPDG